MRKLSLIGSALAVAAGLAVASARANDRAEFRRDFNRGRQSKRTGSFLDAMSKAPVKVNGFYASDYAGVIEAMRFNKVQIAWYGNKSAMEGSTARMPRCSRRSCPRWVDGLLLAHHRQYGFALYEAR